METMESIDYRHTEANGQAAELDGFWQRWREFYGETGLVNPRGDKFSIQFNYSTGLAADRFISTNLPESIVPKDNLVIAPGFVSTRLPLAAEVMPSA